MRYAFQIQGRVHHVTIEEHAEGPRILVDGEPVDVEATKTAPHQYNCAASGFKHRVVIDPLGAVEVDGQVLGLNIRRAKPEVIRKGGANRRNSGMVKPPMPGKIVEVHVEVGQEIKEGEILLVLEAMKMQNDLKSPIAGVIEKVHVQPGQNVEATTVMVEIKAPEE